MPKPIWTLAYCAFVFELALGMQEYINGTSDCGDGGTATFNFNFSGFNVIVNENGVDVEWSNGLPDLPVGTTSGSYGPIAPCGFDGVIVVAGPLTYNTTGTFYSSCLDLRRSMELFADWLHTTRDPPGIQLNGKRFAVRFHWVDDWSRADMVANATAHAIRVNGADFAVGPFSSTLTEFASMQSEIEKKVMLTSAASSTSVFQGRNLTFGLQPPARGYLDSSIETIQEACLVLASELAGHMPCKIGLVQQSTLGGTVPNSFGLDTCSGVQEFINETWCHHQPTDLRASYLSCALGANSASAQIFSLEADASEEIIASTLRQLQSSGVNVLVGCVFDGLGISIVKMLEMIDWAPYASVLTTTVTASTYTSLIHNENFWQGEYILGTTPWYSNSDVPGAVSGWSSKEFNTMYQSRYNRDVSEEGAAAFAAGIALMLAIEAADSIDADEVAFQLSNLNASDFYGPLGFDANGQHAGTSLTVQFGPGTAGNSSSVADVLELGPVTLRLSNGRFPMPTWAERRCRAYGGGSRVSQDTDRPLNSVECSGRGWCTHRGDCDCLNGFSGSNCEESEMSVSTELIVILIVVAALLVIVACLYIYTIRKKYIIRHTPHDFDDDLRYLVETGVVSSRSSDTDAYTPTEIPRRTVEILDVIGSGEFGKVTRAFLHVSKEYKVYVAVKELKNNAALEDRSNLLKEALVTSQFDHENVVKLLGVVTKGDPLLVILQYASLGCLRNFLRAANKSICDIPLEYRDPQDPALTEAPFSELTEYCYQASKGLSYLASKKFIHRDIATRNILITIGKDKKRIVQISDFGMTKFQASEYYRVTDFSDRVPIRWTAIEALEDQRFSEASDVWAFGVTCVEIYTLGKLPYNGWMNSYVFEMVRKGYRLPKPLLCPEVVYNEVIWETFEMDTTKRPTFADISTTLKSIIKEPISGSRSCSDADASMVLRAISAMEDNIFDSRDVFEENYLNGEALEEHHRRVTQGSFVRNNIYLKTPTTPTSRSSAASSEYYVTLLGSETRPRMSNQSLSPIQESQKSRLSLEEDESSNSNGDNLVGLQRTTLVSVMSVSDDELLDDPQETVV